MQGSRRAVSLRIVMMGTGAFAVPTFSQLIESPHDVVGLFTQPDRKGRGHHRHHNPLKELALEHGIPVFQPQNVNDSEALDSLAKLNPDLCVVAAYGQILSAKLLQTPRLGAINIHASLLPKYRGAAPIHYAILNGETETGITIFQIEPKLDAGPILGVVSTPIGPKETSGELHERLAKLAGPLTLHVIEQLEAGTAQPVVQNSDDITLAPTMKKSFGQIDWSQPTSRVLCHLRAMQPWPSPFTFLIQPERSPLRLLILDADPLEAGEIPDPNKTPGTVIAADENSFAVRTGDGAIVIRELRPEGKRAMSAADFLRGRAVHVGDQLKNAEECSL
ncbi:MAG: methionyl-tRNA formyltransferase [Planctomycetaceae bacterium]